MSNNISDNRSDDVKGTMLVVTVAIIAAMPLVIGLWAAYTGGGL
ncbi:MAG TPA: hypothetical protein VMV70_04295 [Gallionella sp.]|nr:hypothetical protein [Gallionella sp.]